MHLRFLYIIFMLFQQFPTILRFFVISVTAVCKSGQRITNTALYIDSLLEIPQSSTALCVCNLEIEGKQGVNTDISYYKTASVTGIYFHIEGMGIINPVLKERRYIQSNTVIAFNKSTDGNPTQGACLIIEPGRVHVL